MFIKHYVNAQEAFTEQFAQNTINGKLKPVEYTEFFGEKLPTLKGTSEEVKKAKKIREIHTTKYINFVYTFHDDEFDDRIQKWSAFMKLVTDAKFWIKHEQDMSEKFKWFDMFMEAFLMPEEYKISIWRI